MANPYFEFRQFRIAQDRCAMKVTTDACILGAYAPAPEVGVILDIGAGTGLLSLMLAQRTRSTIDAVEVDPSAFSQLVQNIEGSKWKDRIHPILVDIKKYRTETKYDFIICNPPFFSNHLHSPFREKNVARHDLSLDTAGLLDAAQRLVGPEGIFTVLIPYGQLNDFSRKAGRTGFHLSSQLLIRARPDKPFNRVLLVFETTEARKIETEILSVNNENGEYSDFFRQLLSSFYLHLQRL
jgi:tRNA1Val (adenine37-N6)-methyltransferase